MASKKTPVRKKVAVKKAAASSDKPKKKVTKKKTTKKKVTKKKTTKKKASKKATKKGAPVLYTDRDKALGAFQHDVSQKGFVEILNYTDDDCLAHLKDCVSTGSVAIDDLLGGKGIPLGRVTEIWGPWHIGKSTLLDHIFASCQRAGGVAVVADTEATKSVQYSRSIGVDVDRLQYLNFDRDQMTMEHVFHRVSDTAEWWRIHSPDTKVIIGVDSLAGTRTAAEVIEDDLRTDRAPGSAARVLQFVKRVLPAVIANTNVGVVLLNHEYSKINTGPFRGKTKETYGGEGPRSLASVRMELHSVGEWLRTSQGVTVGRVVGVRLHKDKIHGQTRGEARFALLNGVGIDNTWTIYETLKKKGIIQTSGSWSAINLDGEVMNFQGWAGLQRLCGEPPPEGKEPLFDRLMSVYQAVMHPTGGAV